MARFASIADLASYLGETIAADDARAGLLLDLASGAVQAYTGQLLEAVANDTVTLDANGSRLILLPEVPVTAVVSVAQDGQSALAATAYEWRRDGVLWPAGGATWGREVVVTYSHGFAVIPDVIRGVVLALAGRMWSNPTGAVSESIGTYSITNARTVALELTGVEQAVLDRFRLFDPA